MSNVPQQDQKEKISPTKDSDWIDRCLCLCCVAKKDGNPRGTCSLWTDFIVNSLLAQTSTPILASIPSIYSWTQWKDNSTAKNVILIVFLWISILIWIVLIVVSFVEHLICIKVEKLEKLQKKQLKASKMIEDGKDLPGNEPDINVEKQDEQRRSFKRAKEQAKCLGIGLKCFLPIFGLITTIFSILKF